MGNFSDLVHHVYAQQVQFIVVHLQARITEDIQKVALHPTRMHDAHGAAHQAQQANVQHGREDHVQGVLEGYPATRPRTGGRLHPEAMPAAGARLPHHASGAPFGQFSAEIAPGQRHQADAQQQEQTLWTAAYARPQFARKRCPDLMITGPSIRTAPVHNAHAPQAPGVYAYEGSVTSTTTYVNPTNR